MAGNKVTVEFAGDATKLQKAAKDSTAATDAVAKAADDAGAQMGNAGDSASTFNDRIGSLGAGVTGVTDAIDSAGAAFQGLADIQDAGRANAVKLARAQGEVEQAQIDSKQAAVDLRQAQEDLNQSQLDGKQSAIDVEQAEIDARQAKLDAAEAQKAYNEAVKEYGAGSAEAQQAQIDLTQATSDLNQARLDEEQANADANQSKIDATQATVDATQATRDGKDAQLNLNDAMAAANPSGLQMWADKISLITPLLTAVVGVVGLVTAAQWAWNAAQLASPLTWILLAIGAVIAIIVVIATKTDWFQKLWKGAWGGIKTAMSAVWDWMKKIPGWTKDLFGKIVDYITKPYRVAFNLIADAWNNTIGRLSWTVPDWIPGIGGNTISVPNLPKFHSGIDRVPGPPGSEMAAILQAGETVLPAGSGGNQLVIRGDGTRLAEALIEILELASVTRPLRIKVAP